MAVWAGGDDNDVFRSNGGDDTGGEDDLLPGLSDVNDMDTCDERYGSTEGVRAERRVWLTVVSPFPDVWQHVLLALLAADMALGGEHERNIIVGRVEDGRDLGAWRDQGLSIGRTAMSVSILGRKR